ncbi:MAG: hypothetical protein WD971_07160 [Pirellulales bacterium]
MVASVSDSRSFRVFSARRETAARTIEGIALGVTKNGRDYKLAVRQQETGRLVSTMTEAIREHAKGEVDIRFIGKLAKLASETTPKYYRAKRRPLRIGSSISDIQTSFISSGTLGCFVARRQSPHYLGMLTNNHVIANENGNAIGSPVVQPGTLDGGKKSTGLVGELGKFITLRASGVNFVDAAVGDLYDDVDFDPRRIGNLGNLTGQADVMTLPRLSTVYKVGRTTGQTKGRITAFDLDNVLVEYDLGDLRFDNQIEIEGTGNKAFSDAGDSGSLIVDDQLRAIGLLFAGGDEGGSNKKGLTFANPIEKVLDALKVDLEL